LISLQYGQRLSDARIIVRDYDGQGKSVKSYAVVAQAQMDARGFIALVQRGLQPFSTVTSAPTQWPALLALSKENIATIATNGWRTLENLCRISAGYKKA